MKKVYLLLTVLLLCALSLFAQAPEKFSYQAVVRNATNQLVVPPKDILHQVCGVPVRGYSHNPSLPFS